MSILAWVVALLLLLTRFGEEEQMAPVPVSTIDAAGPVADLFLALHAPVVIAQVPTVEPAPAPNPPAVAVEQTQAAGSAAPAPGCPQVIIDVFGSASPAACAVAWCESRWDPDATGAEGEMGLLQIHPRYHADATYDPHGNAMAAYRISSGGYDWSAWTCGWAAYQ